MFLHAFLSDDDFQDEEKQVFVKNEWQPKSPFGRFIKKLLKVLKKLPKILFILLMVLVWVFIFGTMILRKNDKIVETPILSDKAREIYTQNPDDFPVYIVHTKEFMNEDGDIQLIDSVYAEKANEFEVGLRIKGRVGETLYCRIRDAEGNIMGEVFRRTRERDIKITDSISFQYVFERISFSDVYIDVSKNIINRDWHTDYSAEFSQFDEDLDDYSAYVDKDTSSLGENATGNLFFEVFETKESTTPIFSCIIYNSETPLEEIEYEVPSDSYLS